MIEFHRLLLGDRQRNEAFAKALKSVVKPGAVVADIGSGTGFLSFLASNLGAKECHLFEMDHDMAALSRVIAKKNKIINCKVTAGHSMDVPNPPKADVIVSETLGNYALEEGIVETLNDAVARFLKPGGTVIPRALRQYVAPVITETIAKDLNIWPGIGFDLDFSDAELKTLNNVYVREIAAGSLLEDGIREWDSIDFTKKDNKSVRGKDVSWKVDDETVVHGFCVFWEADLTKDITLSTSPESPMTHWQQIFLPLLRPVLLSSGDTLSLSLRSDTRPQVKVNLTWDVSVKTAEGKQEQRQSLDMQKG